jgi:hypothetical protein
MQALTYSETIFAMMQLGVVVLLWGIYNELRKRAQS